MVEWRVKRKSSGVGGPFIMDDESKIIKSFVKLNCEQWTSVVAVSTFFSSHYFRQNRAHILLRAIYPKAENEYCLFWKIVVDIRCDETNETTRELVKSIATWTWNEMK